MPRSALSRFSQPPPVGRSTHTWRPPTVDFYLYSSHEVAVWESLWRSLRQHGVDAEFVLEPPGTHSAIGSVPDPENGWANDLHGKIVPLVDQSTHDTLTELLASLGLPWIDRSRVDADAVVTTQGIGWLEHYKGLRIKTEYGGCAFVDVYGHGAINQGLDAVLAHGPFSARAISAQVPPDRIHVVGYPKWASAFRDNLTRYQARELLGLSSAQPIVAWLPTWAHNATIDQYSTALGDLAENYLVVAKPHHNSVRFETERLAAADSRILIRQDLHSLVPLMIAADVVVADGRSGALAETFIADRPVVGLLPGVSARSHGVVAGLDDTVVWCDDPDNLDKAVANALEVDRSPGRQLWREWMFADLGGDDDVRAANKIISLLSPLPRSTAGLPLKALDKVLDETEPSAPETFMHMFVQAWELWPGHPRLLSLLEEARGSLDATDLLTCARLVRLTQPTSKCPVRATAADSQCDPIRRLLAAALSAVVFEDADAVAGFCERVLETPTERFDEALFALDMVPDALPAFVEQAATTGERCHDLAVALEELGATGEAATIRAFGAALVTP